MKLLPQTPRASYLQETEPDPKHDERLFFPQPEISLHNPTSDEGLIQLAAAKPAADPFAPAEPTDTPDSAPPPPAHAFERSQRRANAREMERLQADRQALDEARRKLAPFGSTPEMYEQRIRDLRAAAAGKPTDAPEASQLRQQKLALQNWQAANPGYAAARAEIAAHEANIASREAAIRARNAGKTVPDDKPLASDRGGTGPRIITRGDDADAGSVAARAALQAAQSGANPATSRIGVLRDLQAEGIKTVGGTPIADLLKKQGYDDREGWVREKPEARRERRAKTAAEFAEKHPVGNVALQVIGGAAGSIVDPLGLQADEDGSWPEPDDLNPARAIMSEDGTFNWRGIGGLAANIALDHYTRGPRKTAPGAEPPPEAPSAKAAPKPVEPPPAGAVAEAPRPSPSAGTSEAPSPGSTRPEGSPPVLGEPNATIQSAPEVSLPAQGLSEAQFRNLTKARDYLRAKLANGETLSPSQQNALRFAEDELAKHEATMKRATSEGEPDDSLSSAGVRAPGGALSDIQASNLTRTRDTLESKLARGEKLSVSQQNALRVAKAKLERQKVMASQAGTPTGSAEFPDEPAAPQDQTSYESESRPATAGGNPPASQPPSPPARDLPDAPPGGPGEPIGPSEPDSGAGPKKAADDDFSIQKHLKSALDDLLKPRPPGQNVPHPVEPESPSRNLSNEQTPPTEGTETKPKRTGKRSSNLTRDNLREELRNPPDVPKEEIEDYFQKTYERAQRTGYANEIPDSHAGGTGRGIQKPASVQPGGGSENRGPVPARVGDGPNVPEGAAPQEAAPQRGDRRVLESRALIDWAKDMGRTLDGLPDEFDRFSEQNKGQGEHDVWYDRASDRWLKVNNEDFGIFPITKNGELKIAGATPREYLQRLRGMEEKYGVKTEIHGVLLKENGQPALVTSQPNVVGSKLSWNELSQKLKTGGYLNVSDEHSMYYRPSNNTLLFDAHPGNFREVNGELKGFDVGVIHPEGELRKVAARKYAEMEVEEARRNQR